MANEYFTASGNPATRATATSASMRAEFAAIVAGFDKLPTMTGNGGKLLVVNSAGTALTASSTIYEVSGKIGIATATPGTALGFVNGAQISWGASNYAYVSGSNATNILTFGTQATERMRIDASGNMSVGTATATSRVTVAGDVRTLAGGLLILNNPTNTAAGSVGFVTGDNLVFYGGGSTERMRIDASGNVGIGLTSPTNKLDVNGTVGFWASGTQIGSAFNDSLALNLQANNNATAGLKLGTSGSTPIVVYTNGSERMRIDASGNLGVGATPSAWGGGTKALQFSSGYVMGTGSGALFYTGANNYYDGTNYRYVNTAAATQYSQTNGAHNWLTATSGTAGNPITFTQAMTLDASGNLGLGATPSSWSSGKALEIGTAGNALWGYSGNVILSQNTAGYAANFLYATTAAATRYQQTAGQHQWHTAPSGTAGNAITFTQAMTLDASGNLGLGVIPSTWTAGGGLIQVPGNGFIGNNSTLSSNSMYMGANAYYDTSWKYRASGLSASIFQAGNGTFTWYIAPSGTAGSAITFTQPMSLDANGRLLHGTTSASVTNGGFLWVPGADSIGYIGHASGSASGNGYLAFQYAGTLIGSITQNGTTAVAYNTSSDYRLKDITGPVTGSGEYIDALNPVVGSWKADGAPFVGLIAHEVQDISSTQVATGVKDGEVMQSMDYSAPEIMANIIAELKSLRARVANLEAA